MTSAGKRFREAIGGPCIEVLPMVHNALSVHLVARTGYRCAGIAGSVVSATLLGMPDAG